MSKMSVGIFGGTFDPLHYGHINSMLTMIDQLELDRLLVIPAFHSPGRALIAGPTAEQRLEMLKLGLKDRSDKIEILDCEIQRGGESYTIDTLDEVCGPEADYFLVIGVDQFEQFDQWKDFSKILDRVHLVVTSRPGFDFPDDLEEFPMAVQPLVSDFDGDRALLNQGKEIRFVDLKDVDVSATEIRRRLRQGQDIHKLMPSDLADHIKKNKYYLRDEENIGDFNAFTVFCAEFLESKGGIRVVPVDVSEQQFPMEYAIISSGTSTRATIALAENLVREVKDKYSVWPLSIEGQREGRWVVVDYGALIVHVFYDYVRQEYRLEELWRNGKVLAVNGVTPSPAALPKA